MDIDGKGDESIPRFEMVVTPEKHLDGELYFLSMKYKVLNV